MKRGLIIGLALVLFSGLLGGCGKDWSHIQAEDFVLTITLDKMTYGRHEDIIINISLENKSGEDLEIGYYFLFVLDSPTGMFPAIDPPQDLTMKNFKDKETIYDTENLRGYFEAGVHEIVCRTTFYIKGVQSEEMTRRIRSNTITITVTE